MGARPVVGSKCPPAVPKEGLDRSTILRSREMNTPPVRNQFPKAHNEGDGSKKVTMTLGEARSLLDAINAATADLWQLARVAQYNLTGADIVFPEDAAAGRPEIQRQVHQAGVDETLAIRERLEQQSRHLYTAVMDVEHPLRVMELPGADDIRFIVTPRGVYLDGMTVAELQEEVNAWPTVGADGLPTEVWIETGDMMSSPCAELRHLNFRKNDDGVPVGDMLLVPQQRKR